MFKLHLELFVKQRCGDDGDQYSLADIKEVVNYQM